MTARIVVSLGLNLLLLVIPAAFGDDSTRLGGQSLRKPEPAGKVAKTEIAPYTAEENASYERGGDAYFQLCHACHGEDGTGAPIIDDPDRRRMAPSLSGSRRVLGRSEYVITALLTGVSGPVDGENYQGQMVSMSSYSDAWIADVASFIRNSFGNEATMITANQVTRLRARLGGRTDPFTVDEILSMMPAVLTNQALWKAAANCNSTSAGAAIDGNAATAWSAGKPQAAGDWFQIELPEPVTLWDLNLESPPAGALAATGFPRAYKVQTSMDGTKWSDPIAVGTGRGRYTLIALVPVRARFVRVTLTAVVPDASPWAISRTQILRQGERPPDLPNKPRANPFE